MKVLAFGEILWDVIERTEHLGGAPFNFAAHSAQCGNDASIVSRLGTDHLGMRAFNDCKAKGVSQRLIQWDEKFPTGTVDVKLTDGQPDYLIHANVAYDFISSDSLPATESWQTDVFYFGSLAQRSECSANTLQFLCSKIKSRYTFYDVNLRKLGYTESIIRTSLEICNVFKLNTDELPAISVMLTNQHLSPPDFAQKVIELFPAIETIIITAAEKGCYVYNHVTGFTHVPGVPVKVADAVGAGDAFSAAFMHMMVKIGDPVLAAKVANEVGAFVASKTGAVPTYTPEIKTLLGVD